MYKVTIECGAVVNFSHKLTAVREMMNLVYRSFLNFANRLCSLEKRICSYQANHGYSWIEDGARNDVTSDFYSYVKVNQRRMSVELNELNVAFEQCKKQAETLILDINQAEHAVYKVSNAPVVDSCEIIPFRKKPNNDTEVIDTLSELLRESEKLSNDIREKHESVSDKAAALISHMRGQFQA